jgi:hypothetical protein
MDFSNHREGGMIFYQVVLLSPLQCKVTELYVKYIKGLKFEEICKFV